MCSFVLLLSSQMEKSEVKFCFERVFMLLLCMYGFVAFLLIMQYCYVFMLEKTGLKEHVFCLGPSFLWV